MALPLTRCCSCRQASVLLVARRWCTSTSSPVAPSTLSSSTVAPSTLSSSPVAPATLSSSPVAPATLSSSPVAPATLSSSPVAPSTLSSSPVAPATLRSSPVAPATLHSSPVAPATLRSSLLLLFSQRFYDIDMLLNWSSRWKHGSLRRKNAYYGYTQSLYGENIATAYYILCMKGGFRHIGHSEWFRPGRWGRLNWDFLNHRETLIEEIDMSNTLINYRGMDNLVGQTSLRTLSLRGCPEVDDWSLTRLHEFQDSLEELDISHCPHITVRGLSALSHLKRLRRLDISSLPGLSSPGLVIILLEEMLPHCLITATGYDLSLRPEGGTMVEMGQRSDRGSLVEV